uniref:NADH dehydrogenase subunit 4l n=1 Tax=Colposcenia ignota TaxID=3230277 RepID=A0AAU8G9A3_9HEMI
MVMIFLCLIMFYFGIKTFFMNQSHLLIMLLSLEFLVMVILLMLSFLLGIFGFDYLLMIYFMVILVCEAVLGLILLTMVVRCHGSDYIKSVILSLC